MKRYLALLPLVPLLLAGCRDTRRRPSEQWTYQAKPVTVGTTLLDEHAEPADVVTALLGLLKRVHEIRREGLGDPARAAEFESLRAQIRSLAAGQTIHSLALSDPYHMMPKNVSVERAIELVSDQWPSIVAYYIEGIDPDSITQEIPEPSAARVSVRACNPRDRQIINEIERSLADQRDIRGEPLRPGTAAYHDELKRLAIARGVAPPVEARIDFGMKREGNMWRVVAIRVGDDEPSATTQIAVRRAPAAKPTTTPSLP